jgi:hypothetical protein
VACDVNCVETSYENPKGNSINTRHIPSKQYYLEKLEHFLLHKRHEATYFPNSSEEQQTTQNHKLRKPSIEFKN